MLRKPAAIILLALCISTPLAGASKRRAASKPSFDTSTPAGWLTKNARVLHTTELAPYSYDLDSLRFLVGHASMVGLGDGTHGTHEFYTVKLRVIEWLVWELGFDTVAFEAPLPLFDKLNEYVQGGPGDPRAILRDANDRLLYFFWNVEEMLAVIEWMREYNLRYRGQRPTLVVTGFDMFDGKGAAEGVIAYLQSVDPPAAAQAQTDYQCILTGASRTCLLPAASVRERLVAKRTTYVAATGLAAYEDALQYAAIANQHFQTPLGPTRDALMAENALWIHGHRGMTGKTILWGHNEHIGENRSDIVVGDAMGLHIARALGDDYFTIGTMTAAGTFRYWQRNNTTGIWSSLTTALPAPPANAYESRFRTRGLQAMLVPLDGSVPAWLRGPAPYLAGGTSALLPTLEVSLPERFDAVIFVDTTTPTTPLP